MYICILYFCKFVNFVQSGSSIRTFHMFLPMLGNHLRSYVPISLTVSTRCCLVSTSFKILSSLTFTFSVWIICLISSWLVPILHVYSSLTYLFRLISMLVKLSQVLLYYLTVLTHHWSWSSVSDSSLNMRPRRPPLFAPNTVLSLIISSSNWANSQELNSSNWANSQEIIFPVMSSRQQISHLLLGRGEKQATLVN